MISFGLKKKDAHLPDAIFVGLTHKELDALRGGGVVKLSYERLGLSGDTGEGQLLIFGTPSDEDALEHLKKRLCIPDGACRIVGKAPTPTPEKA